MNSLQINTGEIRISINDDPTRIVSFNPSDAGFAERFYKIVGEFEEKLAEFQSKAKDAGNLQTIEQITILKETCEFVRMKIDYVFGAGTSQTVFGDSLVLDSFSQFFDGITPYIRKARTEKIAKYVPNANGKKKRRRAF
jgi:uncharacterized protein YfcZ (UPF0381/DUF406 family)